MGHQIHFSEERHSRMIKYVKLKIAFDPNFVYRSNEIFEGPKATTFFV